MKFKKKIGAQLMIAFGVMIVSFSTLFVTMYQASIMNKQTEILLTQTKANAWPCLMVEKTELGGKTERRIEEYRFKLVNKGTGPAIISGVRLTYKGQVAMSWNHLFEIMQTPNSIVRSRTIGQISKGVLSANETTLMIDFTNRFEFIKWMKKNGADIKIEIYYKSVFNETWKIERLLDNTATSYPVQVDKCSIPENEMFMN